MKYRPINKKLFIENRKRFVAKMKPNSIAIFNANDEVPRSADSLHDYRPNPDLFYLTGITQEQTSLILFPDHPDEKMREILFIREADEHLVIWEGHKHSKEEASKISGIPKIEFTEKFNSTLIQLMLHARTCYLNLNEHTRSITDVPNFDLRFAREMCQKYPLHQYERAAVIMHELRAVKSPLELELTKEAVRITESAFRRVLAFVRPGVYEYEVEAEIMHEYYRNAAEGPGYPSIIASGANSCILHYMDNDQICRKGDVLLMDFGANYAHYGADLTRTIPVKGRFTRRQKAIYKSVLNVLNQAQAMLVPGTILKDYNEAVGELVQEELLKLKLLTKKDIAEQDENEPAYKKYFMHGTSHYLGIDIHDVGSFYRPIEPGMVFTCEPGIYVKEEGIGIRLENDILVTEKGPINLMENTPIEVEEIEDLMND